MRHLNSVLAKNEGTSEPADLHSFARTFAAYTGNGGHRPDKWPHWTATYAPGLKLT